MEAVPGVGPNHGRGRQIGQPAVHLLTDQPGGPIEPLLRRTGEELQVRGHRTVVAQERIGLSLRPGTPRRLAGMVRVVALEVVLHRANLHEPARQFLGLGVAQRQDVRAGVDSHAYSARMTAKRQVIVEILGTLPDRPLDEPLGRVLYARGLQASNSSKSDGRANALSPSDAVCRARRGTGR